MEEVSRRSFLKGAALAAGSAAVAGSLAGCSSSSSDTDTEAETDSTTETATFAERPEQGGGIPTDWGAMRSGGTPIEPADVPDSWDAEADVVVVGSGMGGLSAALYLAEAGKDVILVEKESITGGAGRHASNLHCNSGGTKLHQEIGYGWPEANFDPDDDDMVNTACAAYLEAYGYGVDSKLLRRQVTDCPKWLDWMCEQDGFELEAATTLSFYPLRDVELAANGYNDIIGNTRIIDGLTADFENEGGTLMTNTKCTALVADEGAVVGIVVGEDDEQQYFKANDGVILCAGGMGYNMDLLEKYIPTAYDAAVGGPITSHTGECIRMGLGMGADMAGVNSFSSWMGALDDYWGEGTGMWWSYMWRPVNFMAYLPFLAIDRMGNRVPHYKGQKDVSNPQPLYEGTPFNSGMGACVAAYMGVPGHRKYMIFDANYDNHWSNEWAGTDYEYYDPDWLYVGLVDGAEDYLPESWEADFQTCVDNGSIKKADTIEELAELCGFEPDVMVAAVDRWNELCDAGVDEDLIVPMPAEWMTKVDTPPYYCACFGAEIGKTLCGLRVNDKMQVINEDFEVIPGLYAGWSTAGGFTGENDWSDFGACTPSGSVSASGMSGWVAARAILGEYDD